MGITVRLATREDNAGIQRMINRVYNNGVVQLSFQRDPDFFVGQGVIGVENVLAVALDDEKPGEIAGLTNMAGHDMYISGQPRRLWYSSETRVDFPYRRLGVASSLFAEQRKYRTTEDLLHGIVMKGNTAPLDAAKRISGGILFDYWVSHTIETSFIYVRRITPRLPDGVQIRRATAADVPAMQTFFDREAPRRNGYPLYDFSRVLAGGDPYYAGLRIDHYLLALRNGRIVGITGLWDQKAYKQTKIVGYKSWINALRPLANLWFSLAGGLILPPVGGQLNYVNLHTILIENDDAAVLRGLIDWIMVNDGQKYDALATAQTEGDPLLDVARSYKRQKLQSEHFWLSYGEDPRPGIDGRPLYVELARL